MQRKKLIQKLKDQNLIKDDEVYRLVVEHDKKELEKVKSDFDNKFKELRKKGKLDFLGLS